VPPLHKGWEAQRPISRTPRRERQGGYGWAAQVTPEAASVKSNYCGQGAERRARQRFRATAYAL